ncbi:hypothetical protein [Streptomyces sp. NPDC091278]|uniref:hypothetical protein n=1 Tax=Streptomyces sp. NPDC091278 TaxID=3155301 RepID=UPI00344D9402
MGGPIKPNLTNRDIVELQKLRGPRSTPVPDAFLVRLVDHFGKAEADGVLNPARHLAERLGVTRTSVLTYMRMARRRNLTVRAQP